MANLPWCGEYPHMMIDEFQARKKRETAHDEKEIKVKIPLDYHIRLHTVKVVKGQAISDTVKIALENYFNTIRTDTGLAPLAASLLGRDERTE